jgi:ATP-binding cassette, subfamily F, member 3
MIQLHQVRYSIGPRVLFDQVDWVIAPGDRHALVGPNGAGKTTLLRILIGVLEPESGRRVMTRGTRIGYLPQEAAERFDGTVLDRAMEAFRTQLDLREELDALHGELDGISPDDPRLEALLARAGDLQHQLDLEAEHALEPEARRVLSGLGFSRADQDRPLAEFSGGWRMRAALAALLLTHPTVLLLDEPTNHLDLPAMEWLEDYLEAFAGALVVVSHDRVFLDRVASRIQELDQEQLTPYATSFTGYLEERERRREQIEAKNEQLGQRVAQLQRFVDRFGAKNTKAAQAQSKRKMIERLKEEHVVLRRSPRGIRFSFPPPPHAGRLLVRLDQVAFGYQGHPTVFQGARAEIAPGDKVAIVGANGAGKTTLLRVLAGQLAPRDGGRETWPHTKLAYFAQHAAESLEGEATALEALESVAPPAWRPRLRSLLGNFLISGDDVFKFCRVLSGGERQRVALARILLEPANLILLDEPTHHLDLAGKEVLEEALAQYPGAVVVVTHDRSLMSKLATRILEVRDGRVTPYPGGYDDYESARLEREVDADDDDPDESPSRAPAPAKARAATTAPAAKVAKPAAKPTADRTQDRKRDRELKRLEKELAEREAELKSMEAQLADPEVYADGPRARDLVGRYERLRAEVESLWQRLGEL